MAEVVIYFFEEIQVNEDHCKAVTRFSVSADFIFEALFSKSAVMQTGQWIKNREVVKTARFCPILGGDFQLFQNQRFALLIAHDLAAVVQESSED